MYTIELDGETFFDPRIDGYPLGSPRLIREANKIGTLTFTLFPGHPAYDSGKIQMLKSIFTVRKDGAIIYKGRPAYNRRTFKGAIEYKCEELTAILNDFKMRPIAFSGGTDAFIQQVLSQTNGKTIIADFVPGELMNAGTISVTTERMGGWDAIQKYCIAQFGGYLIPDYTEENTRISYQPEDNLPEASQKIQFGRNLLDLFLETDTNETYSAVIPIGGQNRNIDITTVNDDMDVLVNPVAVDVYGYREIVKEWLDIDDPLALKEAGEEWLRGNSVKFRQTVNVSAIDLHNADMGIESFNVLQWINVESSRHGLNTRYILLRDEVPLDNPKGTVLKLGGRTYTEIEQ